VLGANSALPTPDRFSSSFVLNYNHDYHLLDCGEGAQIKMVEYNIKPSRLKNIFITHLHGDHIYGLPGLLTSLNLNNRTKPIKIFGPVGIRNYIEHMISVTGGSLQYPLEFTEIVGSDPVSLGVINSLEVMAIPLKHRIPTYGYVFKEHISTQNVRVEAIGKYALSVEEIQEVKKGNDIIRDNGIVIANDKLAHPLRKGRKFSYCTDTMYDPEIVQYVDSSDMLYHEATYLDELKDKARERMHATTVEAAQIAVAAKVKALIIGHYSSRYKNLDPLLTEAQSVFPESFLAIGGKTYAID